LRFVRKNHRAWGWPTYPKSYATIDGAIEARLEKLLTRYESLLTEGSLRAVSLTVQERNPLARRLCVEHYGATCYVCGFSFGAAYGETAEGYIHVHHLEAMAGKREKRAVDPIKDLRPICPNCHAVAHLQTPPLKIEALKRMLNRART
jgi:5-methylcytosine-specific restriction protein A